MQFERGAIQSVWVDKLLGSHHVVVFADGAVSIGNPDLAMMQNQESTPVKFVLVCYFVLSPSHSSISTVGRMF